MRSKNTILGMIYLKLNIYIFVRINFDDIFTILGLTYLDPRLLQEVGDLDSYFCLYPNTLGLRIIVGWVEERSKIPFA